MRFASKALQDNGLPAGVALNAGTDYQFEQWNSQQGVVIDLPLVNANGMPTGVTKRIHLDWLVPNVQGTPHGLGYETTEAPRGTATIVNTVYVSDHVYSVRVNYNGTPRHYIVYLTATSP
jgi:hypothetical protein